MRFLSRTSNYELFLTNDGEVFSLSEASAAPRAGSKGHAGRVARRPLAVKSAAVRIRLVGANPDASVTGAEPLPGRVNYLTGNNPSRWLRDVPLYSKVNYAGVYPGIDLDFYGTPNALEYDLTAHPGADTSKIKFVVEGVARTALDSAGNLTITTAAGAIAMRRPYVYQIAADGTRTPVDGEFILAKRPGLQAGVPSREVGFQLASYDHARPLVIDPEMQIVYSTYLGGTGDNTGPYNMPFVNDIPDTSPNEAEAAQGVALDPSGDVYIVGAAYSSTFPTKNALQSTDNAGDTAPHLNSQVFLAKFDPTQVGAATLKYATYIGGPGNTYSGDVGRGNGDQGTGIAVDGSGDAYIVGTAYSTTDFPNSCGTWGTGNDEGNQSKIYPPGNGFVSEVNAAGNGFVYSCFVNTIEGATANRVALLPSCLASGQSNCAAYVTGETDEDLKAGFPVTGNAYFTVDPESNDGTLDGAGSGQAAYLLVVNGGGATLEYATFWGGTGVGDAGEVGYGIAVDSSGNAYVAGSTHSADMPVTTGAIQTKNKEYFAANAGDDSDAFFAKFNPAGSGSSSLLYSTFLGGDGGDCGESTGEIITGVAVDTNDNVFFAGLTGSDDLPVTTNAYQSTAKGWSNCADTAFVGEINTGAGTLPYLSYLGGSGIPSGFPTALQENGDAAASIALDSSDNVYVTGVTTSTDFPVSTNACDQHNNSVSSGDNIGLSAFVTEMNFAADDCESAARLFDLPRRQQPWRRRQQSRAQSIER